MNNSDEFCEVIITGPDEGWLVGFTRQLVTDRLAACGHHSQIRSVYAWEGEVHDEPETRLALHTRSSLVPAIVERTQRQHPYDVPCVLAVPISHSNTDYRAWILSVTDAPDA
jgi:periplasmic divalent cation tolerance protein